MKLGFGYPRSFVKLLCIGFALVAFPLVLGLISNAVSIRQVSAKSQQAVYQASQVTQISRALRENLTAQERAVRQFDVLGNPALWQSYLVLHQRFTGIIERFRQLTLTPTQRQELDNINTLEDSLFSNLQAHSDRRSRYQSLTWRKDTAAQFLILAELAEVMLKHNVEAIDREIEDLQRLAAATENMMLAQLLALVPVVAFLVAGFTLLLARPIAQIETAIGGLWAGRFERRIEVSGPSDLQSVGVQLDRLRTRLVTLEEQRSRFLRQISHELKTPLTALREGSDLLAEEAVGPLNSKQREIALILTENSQRLRQLIEDLLSYSAADFEQSVLRRQVFHLRDLIETVVDTQRLAWSVRELQVKLTVEDLTLNADREQVRAVIDNLLSNAVKYSPARGTIAISAYRDGDEAVLEVADEGPGIADSDRDKVFDPFYQGRTPAAAGPIKGSGLGLSIVREHVLGHGGRVSLLAAAGGAHFQVRLPLQ